MYTDGNTKNYNEADYYSALRFAYWKTGSGSWWPVALNIHILKFHNKQVYDWPDLTSSPSQLLHKEQSSSERSLCTVCTLWTPPLLYDGRVAFPCVGHCFIDVYSHIKLQFLFRALTLFSSSTSSVQMLAVLLSCSWLRDWSHLQDWPTVYTHTPKVHYLFACGGHTSSPILNFLCTLTIEIQFDIGIDGSNLFETSIINRKYSYQFLLDIYMW